MNYQFVPGSEKKIVSFSKGSKKHERLFQQTQLSIAYPFRDGFKRKVFHVPESNFMLVFNFQVYDADP